MAKDESRETRVRWHDDEWQAVLTAALPIAGGKVLLGDAIVQVQGKVLPKVRLRERYVILASLRKGTHTAAMKRVKAMQLAPPPPAKSEPAPPAPHRFTPGSKHGRTASEASRIERMPGQTLTVRTARAAYLGGFHWVDREWEVLAIEVDRLEKAGQFGSIVRRTIEAQDLVLSAERRRSIEGIKKDGVPKLTATLARALQRARTKAGLGIAAATVSTAPVVAPVAPPAAPAVPPVDAGQAARDDVPRVSPAALRFATTVAYAVDDLLNTQGQAIAAAVDASVNARLSTLSEWLADTLTPSIADIVAKRVAASIQTSLAGVVHTLMEKELGPIEASAPNGHAAVLDVPPPQDATRPKRVPVDVVGFSGYPETIVRKAIEPAHPHLDLRFIEPRKGTQADYRANVIAAAKFLSHGATNRMRAHGAEVVTVKGGAQSAIEALQALGARTSNSEATIHH